MTTAGFPHSDTPGSTWYRFLVPRHPPCALKNLATDARVHCVVLKQRPATRHTLPEECFTGAGTEDMTLRPYLQDPTMPTNQRSTHELTVQNVCLQSVLCSLERR